jgi:transcriptional regulator with XRE-family HTH domain
MDVTPFKIERVKREFTQAELATRSGIPQPRISLLERGVKPRPDEARALADVFGLEVPELFQTAEGGSLPMSKLKPPSYSWSAIEIFFGNDAWIGCPFAYKKVRIDKIPRADNEAKSRGQILHRLVADYLNRLIHYGYATDWTWAIGATPGEAPADVPEIWQRFYENFVLPPMKAPEVERKLAFNRSWEPVEFFAPDAFFRLVVDLTFRQDGLAVVVDWKSNRIIPETVEKNLQLKIYGWAVKKAIYPDAQEVLLRLHFLRYGAEREILLAPGDLAGVPQELEEKIAIIEAEKHFDPRPGSYCGWCGVTAHCPTMSQALVPVEVLAPVSQEQAVKAATLLLAIEEMSKALKDRLKDWVKAHGALVVGDLCYGPVQSVSYDLDPQAVTQQLLDAGLDQEQVWGLLGITKTSLERGLKKLKRKELIEQVLAQAESKVAEKIGWKKC